MSVYRPLLGLVVCGGKSRRMGQDKSLLNYTGTPQRYQVHRFLQLFCQEVFISCNNMQSGTIDAGYSCIVDNPVYSDSGPLTAILSAFDQFPGADWLVIGCDYPFLTAGSLAGFVDNIDRQQIAAAFYNRRENLYEPVLAWYSSYSAQILQNRFSNKEYSLQYFLKQINAQKYYPVDDREIRSIDTMEEYATAAKSFQ